MKFTVEVDFKLNTNLNVSEEHLLAEILEDGLGLAQFRRKITGLSSITVSQEKENNGIITGMKCEEPNSDKCQCKTCTNMENCYCTYFESSHMCDKCDWSGRVILCPNKKTKNTNV